MEIKAANIPEELYEIMVLAFCFAAPDLLELASTGEIQFVRPSADGNYEILSQEEAAQMMQQPGQTIEIVSDGRDVQVCTCKWNCLMKFPNKSPYVGKLILSSSVVKHSAYTQLGPLIFFVLYYVILTCKSALLSDVSRSHSGFSLLLLSFCYKCT